MLARAIAAFIIMLAVTSPLSAEIVGQAGRVVDGDTLYVCPSSGCVKIRLCGIEAPDWPSTGYATSKEALTTLVQGKSVRCAEVGEGTPCDGRSKPTNLLRVVAQCFVGPMDVSEAMVAGGNACDWRKFSGGHYMKGEGKRCQK